MSNVQVELPDEQPFASRLNEIEKRCKQDIDNLVLRYVINSRDALRMARVIRELAEGFKSFEEIPSGRPMFSIAAILEAYDNLSPDAKEVINDCTAQSST